MTLPNVRTERATLHCVLYGNGYIIYRLFRCVYNKTGVHKNTVNTRGGGREEKQETHVNTYTSVHIQIRDTPTATHTAICSHTYEPQNNEHPPCDLFHEPAHPSRAPLYNLLHTLTYFTNLPILVLRGHHFPLVRHVHSHRRPVRRERAGRLR